MLWALDHPEVYDNMLWNKQTEPKKHQDILQLEQIIAWSKLRWKCLVYKMSSELIDYEKHF